MDNMPNSNNRAPGPATWRETEIMLWIASLTLDELLIAGRLFQAEVDKRIGKSRIPAHVMRMVN